MPRADAPHLLYVAWSYPPARASGVYRALATANFFARDGWRVTVLTVEREAFERVTGTDAGLEAQVDPSIRIERIPPAVPEYQTDLRAWSWLRAHQPELWNALRERRDWRVFPERRYGGWRPVLEAAARRIHSVDPVDLVIATANPHVDFTAGLALAASGVPYVMDYRDAWQLDVFSGRRLTAPGSEADRWESRLVAGAAELWFVNDRIAEWHRTAYPDAAERIHVVANGFEELVKAPVRADRSPLVFGYIGTITEKVPLQAFLDGWRLARSRDPALADAEMRFHGYLGFTRTEGTDEGALLAAAAAENVHFLGPVSKAAVADVYAGLDVLVLLLGTGEYVTSGKVYEYMATGIPGVSIHDPRNAAAEVTAGHPAWAHAADLDSGSIADALSTAARLAQQDDDAARARRRTWALRFRREEQLRPRSRHWRQEVGR